jgi:acetyl esterase/lipase
MKAFLIGLSSAISMTGLCQDNASAANMKDLPYAKVDGRTLALDLHVPARIQSNVLLVYIHGGAWSGGSKDDVPVKGLVGRGYAVASVNYRLSTEARFPANVHDIKAAIRFLRASQSDLGIKADKIVILGSSAGGHLAALVGVSNGLTELEGTVGDHRNKGSDVQGIVSFYGASNLETILKQSTPHGLSVRVPALELLLGGVPENVPELARLASPVAHVDKNDPPLLLIHGDQDPQMPVNQSLELQAVYESIHLPVEFINVHGGAHGGPQFYDHTMLDRVEAFLQGLDGE